MSAPLTPGRAVLRARKAMRDLREVMAACAVHGLTGREAALVDYRIRAIAALETCAEVLHPAQANTIRSVMIPGIRTGLASRRSIQLSGAALLSYLPPRVAP